MKAVVFLVASICSLALAIPRAEEPQVRGQQVSQQSTTASTMAPMQNSNPQMSNEGASQQGQQMQPMQPETNPTDAQMPSQGEQNSMAGGQGTMVYGNQGSQGAPSQAQTPPMNMNQQGTQSRH